MKYALIFDIFKRNLNSLMHVKYILVNQSIMSIIFIDIYIIHEYIF